MISYAADGGGVGPHTDNYDVFLIQARGRRRWRLSRRRYTEDDLVPDLDHRMLARFDVDDDWLLEPGDILYLPPGIAHWGTAVGDCMTYSVGFRAPSQQEIAADWYQWLVAQASSERCLSDPPGLADASGGDLPDTTCQLAAGLSDELPGTDSPAFRQWLGGYLTEPKPQFEIVAGPASPRATRDLLQRLRDGHDLQRHPFARMAWLNLDRDRVGLFCQGRCFALPARLQTLAQAIAARRRIDGRQLAAIADGDAPAIETLAELVDSGCLEWRDR